MQLDSAKKCGFQSWRNWGKLGNNDEIILLDQRNHGDSAVENAQLLPNGDHVHNWNLNGTDLAAAVQVLYPSDLRKSTKFIGIGHSGGGAAVSVISSPFFPFLSLSFPSTPLDYLLN